LTNVVVLKKHMKGETPRPILSKEAQGLIRWIGRAKNIAIFFFGMFIFAVISQQWTVAIFASCMLAYFVYIVFANQRLLDKSYDPNQD
jgi:hypothetical protein